MYVIVRNNKQEYVAKPTLGFGYGLSQSSEGCYTTKLEQAPVFRTREEAMEYLCLENETIQSVESILGLQ